MNINSLILSTLGDVGVPVSFLNYTGSDQTYITFFEYDQGALLEADDEEVSTVYYIQVDVYSPGNYLNLVNQVKQKMKQAGFKKNAETEMYENDTKLFHKVLRFYFISETEE
ncbi:hypothetical protein AB685_29580 [Bacillus sp. LL01]|uniref:hypothetical protein n=1 Tax=Bacillus sp. LL01 TaxID=1665556 RepID=UPI00064D47B2|nr:hypothetical protein [Bacillus sp. LL01]KMJ54993.1 hypothetical protein AB685_29580 [Bacillus sp. LL01]